jgi:hypothetical protein
LALAWIMEHSEGDSAKAMAKYTEVAAQYPNTEYGRRAHEVVYGPEPEPQPGDFEGPSLAELTTPENQEAARLQVMGDSAATAEPTLASRGGMSAGTPGGGMAPGLVVGGAGVAALSHGTGTMAPNETGPPFVMSPNSPETGPPSLADVPVDSTLIAGVGTADPNVNAGLTNPRTQLPTDPGVNPTGVASASATPTAAGAVGSTASAAAHATGSIAGVGAAGASLHELVKATTHEHSVSPPDSTHHDSTGTSSNPGSAQMSPQTALPGGLSLDPLAVPVGGPSPVSPPDTTGAKKAAPAAVPSKTPPQTPTGHKSSEKASTHPGKGSKSSSSSGKNSSSGKTGKSSSSGKSDKKGAAPDSTSGKGSP